MEVGAESRRSGIGGNSPGPCLVHRHLWSSTKAAKQRQQNDDVTAAMEISQRKRAMESSPKISAALVRTVEAAKLQRKKAAITAVMEESQRDAESRRTSQSKALERTVAANERLRAKTAVTAAMKASQRRSSP